MRARTIATISCTLLLSGCDLIRTMFPRHRTTVPEARAALVRCGIAPDSVAWGVGRDGTVAFGRKTAGSLPIPEAQGECFMRWAETNKVKVAFIGWEQDAR